MTQVSPENCINYHSQAANVMAQVHELQTPERNQHITVVKKLPSHNVAGSELAAPMLVAPGWGEGVDDRAISMLAELAYAPVYSFEHIRAAEARRDPHGYKSETLKVAYGQVRRDCNQDFAIVARSEAAIPTVAMLNSFSDEELDRVSGLVLQAPAGLIGPDDPRRLTARTNAELLRNGLNGTTVRLGAKAVCKTGIYAIRDPRLSFKEVMAIANADIHDDIGELIDRGLHVTIVGPTDDRIFPCNRLRQATLDLQQRGLVFLEAPDASHVEFSHPNVIEQIVRAQLEFALCQ